jgi:hypothetical protein
VPSDAAGKHTIEITFDMGPIAGKVIGIKEIDVR